MTVYYADPSAEINVPIKSRTEGGQHILARDIERLPGTVEDDISDSKGFLETLANAVTGGRLAVDLSGTLSGYLQVLANSITANRVQTDVATLPGTVAADMATLAGAIASGNMKVALQAGTNAIGKLAANVGVNIGTVDAIVAQLPTALGQTTKAASVSVAIASDQGALPVSATQLPSALGQAASASSLPVVLASDQSLPADVTTSGQINASVNSTLQLALQGRTSVHVQIPGASSSDVLTAEVSYDSGTTWQATGFYEGATNQYVALLQLSSATFVRSIVIVGSPTHVRLRKYASSGSPINPVVIRATAAPGVLRFSAGIENISLPTTLGSLNAAVTIPLTGQRTVSFATGGSTLVGTLTPEISNDGQGLLWTATQFYSGADGLTATVAHSSGTPLTREILIPGGTCHVRVRVSAYTSGSSTGYLRGNSSGGHTFIGGWLGSGAPTVGQKTMASSLPVALASDQSALVTTQSAPSANYGGRTTVTTAGIRVALASSQALVEGVMVRALDANTGLVYIGTSSVSSTAAGTRLAAGESLFVRINNLASVYIDTAVNGEGVTFLGW